MEDNATQKGNVIVKKKVRKNIGVFILLILLIILLLPYILIHIPGIQNKIKNIAIEQVVKRTKNKIDIEYIYLKPFSTLRLKNVYVEDLAKDTLLFVKVLDAQISPWGILKKNIILDKILLSDFSANISAKDSKSELNFMFLVDAFSSTEKEADEKPNSFSVYLNEIELKSGKLSYNIISEKRGSGFNASHINITQLNAKLAYKMISPDSMYAKIKTLSFKEESGLIVENLSAEAFKKGDYIDIVNLSLKTPNSNIKIPKAKLENYDTYSLSIKSNIKLTDFTPFSPFLKNITTPIILSGELNGNIKNKMLNLTSISLDYGNSLSLRGNAKIEDVSHWETSKFKLGISKLLLDRKHVNELTSLGVEKNILDMVPDGLNLQLTAEGTLSKFKTTATAKTSEDDIGINGTAGYNRRTKETFIDAFLDAKKINLSRWIETNALQNSSSFTAHIRGRIDRHGRPHFDTKVNFKNFFFNNYNYNNINIKAGFVNNVLKSEFVSKDSLASVKLEASGTFIPNKQIDGKLTVIIDSLCLSKLNYADSALDIRLRGKITAEAKGKNLDEIVFNSTIKDLVLQTTKGVYTDSLQIDYSSVGIIKKALIQSNLIDFYLDGEFTLDTLIHNARATLAGYYPSFITSQKPYYFSNQFLNAKAYIKNTTNISKVLNLPLVIQDTANLLLTYNNTEKIKLLLNTKNININNIRIGNISALLTPQNDSILNMNLGLDYFMLKDTMRFGLDLVSKDKQLSMALNLENRNESNKVQGNTDYEININSITPLDINIDTKESSMKIYNHTFKVLPANIVIKEKEYIINNLGLVHSETEFLRLNGTFSSVAKDSLVLNIGDMRLESIINALDIDFPITGLINGDIHATQIFTTPRIFTQNFSISNIHLADSLVGDFKVSSLWNTERDAILLNSSLSKADKESTIAAIIKPSKDSIRLRANINDFTLSTLSPLTKGLTYELSGLLNTSITVNGKISDPEIIGKIYFKNVEMGINKTLCKYFINDSISLDDNLLTLKNFRIIDHQNKDAIIDGTLKYNSVTTYEPKLNLSLDDFNVLNNSKHTDSLFFGSLRLSGNIDITGNEKDLLVNAHLKNGSNSDIKINLPDNIGEAEDYESVIFINRDSITSDSVVVINRGPFITGVLPLRLRANLLVTDDLKLGVVINASTKDMASVVGKGELDFSYDMSNGKMSLLGKYAVDEGSATISLKGITKKKFTVKPGGTVSFKGDPMATSFDVTAIHSVQTYLSTLDPSFENDMNLSSNKVRVDCAIGVVGDINKMDISYNIELPNVNEDVKRKVEGLISTDEIKIKEVAYLLALGSFYPPVSYEASSGASGNMWANLASSSLTNQLNNMLSGVLKENWSIGTNFRSDDDYSNIDMDVSVSTRLLNNRLTINTNLGMRSSGASTKSTFVGDFDAQYKLTKSGSWIINAYNITNDQYYKQSATTQGVGVVYQKSAKTFKDLFRSLIERLKRKEEKDVDKDKKE